MLIQQKNALMMKPYYSGTADKLKTIVKKLHRLKEREK